MKKVISIVLFLTFSMVINAQKDVTKFLGIPVDGTKSAMIQKLKAKGFRSSSNPYDDKDVLEGEFNGNDVRISVVTNNNKVYRIMVMETMAFDEGQIKTRFNKLCHQFDNNPKYIGLYDYTIPNDEKISYEMLVNKKQYQTLYYQVSKEAVAEYMNSKYTKEQLENMSEDIKSDINSFALIDSSKKVVWFTVLESSYGNGYRIYMFYDNEYNHANGEDL